MSNGAVGFGYTRSNGSGGKFEYGSGTRTSRPNDPVLRGRVEQEIDLPADL